jgi:hypothetical protein
MYRFCSETYMMPYELGLLNPRIGKCEPSLCLWVGSKVHELLSLANTYVVGSGGALVQSKKGGG